MYSITRAEVRLLALSNNRRLTRLVERVRNGAGLKGNVRVKPLLNDVLVGCIFEAFAQFDTAFLALIPVNLI